MQRGTERLSLAERIHGTTTHHPAPEAPPVKACIVNDRHGRLPGLLLGWRRTPDGWEGRVVRPVLDISGRWVIVEDWLPAGLLKPG